MGETGQIVLNFGAKADGPDAIVIKATVDEVEDWMQDGSVVRVERVSGGDILVNFGHVHRASPRGGARATF